MVTPFLPGDSLLFIAGAICATGGMDPWLLGGLLMVAAITGDSTSYVIGRTLGKRLFSNPDSKVFRRDYLDRTHEFYERHGGKTVTLARFLPIVRTFAPFVAGMAKMHYPRFVMFSVVTVAWVGGLVTLGYFFGNVPFIKKNLSLLVIGIILLSLLPMILGFIRHRLQASAANRPRPRATEHVVVPRLATPAPAGTPPGGRKQRQVRRHLPILDGLDADEDRRLRERAVLFLADKHLTALAGVDLDDFGRLLLAAQAQLPLLHLPELNWYQGFHELVLYPDDFVSPQKHRDASGVVHEFDDERSGETSCKGRWSWPGPASSAGWLGCLQPGDPRTGAQAGHAQRRRQRTAAAGMRIGDWAASAMQAAYDG